ncbi:hypothetical protein [Cellulosilyticum lentocellum]|uniref:M3 family oligoendopeptidase n=1 Tax=Cellulosilyticum lentocellum (strain ATCC 49066 / DSM 5427 / NCIMB 11756 / RHM5) TaxID=642492 RepID=F2JJX9_CELLD|nr:hypothetical protein [Cellulosilyticum lentocellum]ADZ83261.1 hypothetical protein Clole_1535 [Cellulosilyticum lentocellum DSM 5427]
MRDNDIIQAEYEEFEGDVRKLEELIGQLELWSDEYTINHKREEVRLPEYVELHLNLEALKEQLFAFINQQIAKEGKTEWSIKAETDIKYRLASYRQTEAHIHKWIRDIKDIYILIAKSPLLEKNRAYIEEILKTD